MIIDRLENIEKYVSLNPLFAQAFEFLKSHDLKVLEPGKTELKDAPYSEEKDITFFEGPADSYIDVKPGMFAIFFPQDGHAPAITPNGVKKIIIKVKA